MILRKTLLFVVLAIFISACNSGPNQLTQKEKNALKSRFFNPNFIMADTMMTYHLYPDSLVLTFTSKAHYSSWITHMILRLGYSGELSRTNSIDLGYSEKHVVKNNQLVFTGFHISPDSTDLYLPELFGFPNIGIDTFVAKVPTENNQIFFKRQRENEILTPWGPYKKNKYVAFYMNQLKGLNPMEKEYCHELMEKELKTK